MKRSAMPRKRTAPRRTTSPRCANQRCKKRAEIAGLCVSHAEQRADRLFSRWVRDTDGRCTAAGVLAGECKGILQAAHIVGRRNYSVRFCVSPRNVWSLCAAHHYTVDQHGQEHAKYRWALAVLGADDYDVLMEIAARRGNRREATFDALHFLGGDGP